MERVDLIFEIDHPGSRGWSLPAIDLPPVGSLPPEAARRSPLRLPEVSEPEVVRHYTGLSRLNYGLDQGFYPLGSCSMKYNPRIDEDLAARPLFSDIHPLQPEETMQGSLRLLFELQGMLSALTGMAGFSLQPAAGAHGELAGMLMIKAWQRGRGEKRDRVIVPDSAHGTNPATAAMCGYQVVEVRSNDRGTVDMEELEKLMDDRTAAVMLTNPNTLGLFEDEILLIAELVHSRGGQLYYDGANLNAVMGWARPGDMGFDVMHLNLHKTFAAPHGGGGPGAGPVGAAAHLLDYLPRPAVVFDGSGYLLQDDLPGSIGRLRAFICNFSVCLKAYAYILAMGPGGLRRAASDAVLNANYLQELLREKYRLPYARRCMHEFVVSASGLLEQAGVRALDVAKRLMDYGYHPPTVYFPLIVKEAMMIEPTETEARRTLDEFAAAMNAIADEALRDPGLLKQAPFSTPVSRPDEAAAARNPDICLD